MTIKRISAMLAALLMSVSALAGCSSKKEQLQADGYISSLEISSTISQSVDISQDPECA